MAKILDDFGKWLDDTSKVISREAGDLTQKGKLKIEIFDLKWRLRELMTEFGRTVYDLAFTKNKEDWQSDSRVKNLITKIKNATKNLKAKEAEYKKVGK
jgi:hypothetical protein